MTMISVELAVLGCVSGWVLEQLLWPGDEILSLEVSDEFRGAYAESIFWR